MNERACPSSARHTALPPVAASVQQNLKAPLPVARRDDVLLADEIQKEIPRVRDL
jgi:hypothetical protein